MDAGPLPLAELGRVMAEPARLRILQELLGGTPLPAGALAARLGIAPSTTSAHLARLVDARLVTVEPAGRARLARLSSPAVADAVEALLRLTGEPAVSSLSGFDRRAALREARSCYDHLAGRVGVAVADLALSRGWLREAGGAWLLARDEDASALADGLGLTLPWRRTARPAVRPCTDWTERRPHIAGRLGHALLDAMLTAGWLQRRRDDRALRITATGRTRLAAAGVDILVEVRG